MIILSLEITEIKNLESGVDKATLNQGDKNTEPN